MEIEKLSELTKEIATRYASYLEFFRPCKPGSVFLENNLTNILSIEFTRMFDKDPMCLSFSEVPFMSKDGYWRNRIDAFLANSNAAYIVEAKSAVTSGVLIQRITEDLERIHSTELKKSFHEMAKSKGRNYTFPENIYGLIIADFWCSPNKQVWFTEKSFGEAFSGNYKLSSVIKEVGTYGGSKHFIVTAITKLNALDWSVA